MDPAVVAALIGAGTTILGVILTGILTHQFTLRAERERIRLEREQRKKQEEEDRTRVERGTWDDVARTARALGVIAEASVVINRPVEEVFEFVTNPKNDVLWQSGVLESEQTSEGPMRVGTTVRNVSQFLGQRMEWTSEITEYEPNRKIKYKGTSGPMTVEPSYTFEPVQGGTRFTQVTEGETTGGLFRMAEPIVKRMMQKQVEANLANLKDILEAAG